MKTTQAISAGSWHITEADFPADGMPVEQWKFFLRYAVLAPSSHNSQPWCFHISDERLSLYADRSRACRVVDPCDRELIMSCGCALFPCERRCGILDVSARLSCCHKARSRICWHAWPWAARDELPLKRSCYSLQFQNGGPTANGSEQNRFLPLCSIVCGWLRKKKAPGSR